MSSEAPDLIGRGRLAEQSAGAVDPEHAASPAAVDPMASTAAAGDGELLRTIARVAEYLLTARKWERGIEVALAELGQVAGVSRAYIFENRTTDAGVVVTSQRYEWVAEGIVPQLGNALLQAFPLGAAGFGRWEARLGAGEAIQGHVRDLPEAERRVLADQAIRSILVVPIFAEGKWWGFMGLDECRREREWSPADAEALRTAAGILGGAIRHERTATARVAAEVAEQRATFLAKAGAILASSLDYRTTLRSIARLAISSLADSCIIYVVEDDGRIQRIEIAHSDPASERVLWELLARDPPDPNAPRSPLSRVLRSGEAEIISQIEDHWFRTPGHDPAHLEQCRQVMPRSLMCVPLLMRGEVRGAISLGTVAPGRFYGREDLALATDLAARAALAIDNARLYREARQASQDKSEFMAVMSHELKTPLMAITTYAELLREALNGPSAEPHKKQLDVIVANSFHLAHLIDEVLTYTRSETTEVELRREVVDVPALARQLVEWVRPMAETRGLTLELRCGTAPASITTDVTRLRQVLMNLLTNAVRFTDDGGVEVAVEAEADRVWVRVTDTGIGIDAEHQEMIWDPFWQADRSLTRRVEGTGLGLSIVKRLIQLLDGGVAVRSTPGLGSTFSVWIPTERP